MIRHFSELEAWQVARELALGVYKASGTFAREETFTMKRQLRSAATSIAANIAEGFGRYHHKDNLKFLYNARGSLAETESFLLLAVDLGYVDKAAGEELRSLCQRQLMVLNGYIRSIRKRVGGEPDAI